MNIEYVQLDAIAFTDINGIYRRVYGCSLKQRQELAAAFRHIRQVLKKSRYKTISRLYDNDAEFQAIANHILELCHVDPDWLDVANLVRMVLPYKQDGDEHPPLLEALNFPPQQASEDAKPATYAEAIAAIITHTNDLQDALKAAGYEDGEQLSQEQLQQVMIAYNEMRMTPGQRIKREQEKLMERARKKAAQETAEVEIKPPTTGARFASEAETRELLGML